MSPRGRRDTRGHAVVTQPAGVDRVRHEVGEVYILSSGHPGAVAEVVAGSPWVSDGAAAGSHAQISVFAALRSRG